ncbi:hypothetical protein [Stenotrophomonas sp. 24(2023)]|uniref:hypothetical protein n=1 Tax=Stenotrophomonas sp. 24(2023) TaxID=3068324 RepID=UPI0027E130EE|nr:hypothetical protein [Stenotrophomonas sp. 24(2023)]WMJ69561.1 hypothetical protein Q9R17_00155 [Stenotrophomonas sp. 24(2023)]
MAPSLIPTAAAAALLALACAASAATPLQRACTAAPIDDRIALLPLEGKRVSACPPGNDEGCPYSGQHGSTSLDGTPDLNHDGRKDAILTYVGSSHGDIDVTDKLVLAQCADGTYIRLLEGTFTTLLAPAPPHATWPDLEATRDCPTGRDEAARPLTIRLHFDATAVR